MSSLAVAIYKHLMTEFGSRFRNIFHPVNVFTDSQTRCFQYAPQVT